MNINIKTQNTSLTPAIGDYINKRMNSVGKFLMDKGASANFFVQIAKTTEHHRAGNNLFSTEVNISAGEKHVRAEAFDADLYASIDKVRDELVRELTSQKDKKLTLLRRGGQRIKNLLRGFGGENQ
jgi:ribosomal subunit interface protein